MSGPGATPPKPTDDRSVGVTENAGGTTPWPANVIGILALLAVVAWIPGRKR